MSKKAKKSPPPPPLKLNLGCGSNKIKGFVNIDVEKTCKPDLVHDFTKEPLPYKPGTVSEIVLFHTIEHITKRAHHLILGEIYRVLKVGAPVYVSYPNFWECAQNWKNNFAGQREFWHATLYGRQLYPSDYHVCAMDPLELEALMRELGFENLKSCPEKKEKYNSITTGTKGKRTYIRYEELLTREFNNLVIKK